MTNQTLNLKAIAGIQEIDDAVAANYNGGVDLKLCSDAHFGGQILNLTSVPGGGFPDLGKAGFNNMTSSLQVFEGTWQFFLGTNYTDYAVTLVGPQLGRTLGGVLDDNIASVKRIA